MQGKRILITGGTGTLGCKLVEKALACKAEVFFTYYSNQKVKDFLEVKGACGYFLDLTDKKSVDDFILSFSSKHNLDMLINNAAIVNDSVIANLSENDWDSVIFANFNAAIQLIRGFFPILKKSKQAKIINLISRVGLYGAAGQANYAASKGALVEASKFFAIEFAKDGITVNAVNPGFMLSGMTSKMQKEKISDKIKESCLNVAASAEEAADFILYLLSSKVKTITGQIFHLDSRINF